MLVTSSSKPHYEVLDGLRGTAAITIIVFHFLELVWFDYSKNPLGHGFLAVDFFFCLSGFVIGYANGPLRRWLSGRLKSEKATSLAGGRPAEVSTGQV